MTEEMKKARERCKAGPNDVIVDVPDEELCHFYVDIPARRAKMNVPETTELWFSPEYVEIPLPKWNYYNE